MMVRIHRGQLELHPFPPRVGQFVGQFAGLARSHQRAARAGALCMTTAATVSGSACA